MNKLNLFGDRNSLDLQTKGHAEVIRETPQRPAQFTSAEQGSRDVILLANIIGKGEGLVLIVFSQGVGDVTVVLLHSR